MEAAEPVADLREGPWALSPLSEGSTETVHNSVMGYEVGHREPI